MWCCHCSESWLLRVEILFRKYKFWRGVFLPKMWKQSKMCWDHCRECLKVWTLTSSRKTNPHKEKRAWCCSKDYSKCYRLQTKVVYRWNIPKWFSFWKQNPEKILKVYDAHASSYTTINIDCWWQYWQNQLRTSDDKLRPKLDPRHKRYKVCLKMGPSAHWCVLLRKAK